MEALALLLVIPFAAWTVILMVGVGRIWTHTYRTARSLRHIEEWIASQSTAPRR